MTAQEEFQKRTFLWKGQLHPAAPSAAPFLRNRGVFEKPYTVKGSLGLFVDDSFLYVKSLGERERELLRGATREGGRCRQKCMRQVVVYVHADSYILHLSLGRAAL